MVNETRLKSFNTAPKYKYGYKIPRTYINALIRKMVTPYGETPLYYKLMNMLHSLIRVITPK
jgi:hypothetical protein